MHNKSKVRLALLGGELPLVVSSLGRVLFTNDFPFDFFECSPTLDSPPKEVNFAITLLRTKFSSCFSCYYIFLETSVLSFITHFHQTLSVHTYCCEYFFALCWKGFTSLLKFSYISN